MRKKVMIACAAAALVVSSGAWLLGRAPAPAGKASSGAFAVPSAAARKRAIGQTRALPRELQRAYDPAGFAPIDAPGPHDWLARFPEPGQTFDDFARSDFIRPRGARRRIVLQPIGDFAAGRSPSLSDLRDFAAAFFGLELRLLEPEPLGAGIETRRNPYSGHFQALSTDLLDFLKRRLPADAVCLLGVTMIDLYPQADWNFVFGQASLRERVGVFSFARYDPAFYGQERGPDFATELLRRSCKVLSHETGHMFGLLHCTYFQCGMCGSMHLEESDRRPIHLCPICLRKLQHACGFDPISRYERLRAFYERVGMRAEADWVARRLKWIRG
ncbi:MAG: hypothetical protein JXR96_19385 [Deltaproteobacteria bacterium]|nr:hypothetical protein [Deltaproteobacteria bacterium]